MLKMLVQVLGYLLANPNAYFQLNGMEIRNVGLEGKTDPQGNPTIEITYEA